MDMLGSENIVKKKLTQRTVMTEAGNQNVYKTNDTTLRRQGRYQLMRNDGYSKHLTYHSTTCSFQDAVA